MIYILKRNCSGSSQWAMSARLKGFLNDTEMRVEGSTVKEIIDWMERVTEYYSSPYPIIDETGYSGKLGGIHIEDKIFDPVKLDQAFNKYGMALRIEKREVSVLIISD